VNELDGQAHDGLSTLDPWNVTIKRRPKFLTPIFGKQLARLVATAEPSHSRRGELRRESSEL
jgi:hypothetical protein